MFYRSFNIQPSESHFILCIYFVIKSLELRLKHWINLCFILCISEENQQRKQVVEKERLFINNYKLKIQNKITAFLKDSEETHLQFESEDKILRTIWYVF